MEGAVLGEVDEAERKNAYREVENHPFYEAKHDALGGVYGINEFLNSGARGGVFIHEATGQQFYLQIGTKSEHRERTVNCGVSHPRGLNPHCEVGISFVRERFVLCYGKPL